MPGHKNPKGTTIFPMIGRCFLWFLCLDDFARHGVTCVLPFTYLFLMTFTSLISMLADLGLSMFGIFRSLDTYIKKRHAFETDTRGRSSMFSLHRLPLGRYLYILGDLLKIHDNLNQPYIRYSFGARLSRKTGP